MTSFTLPAVAAITTLAFVACSKSQPATNAMPAAMPSSSTASAAPAMAMPAPAAKPYTMAMVAEGDSLYHARTCKNCHGPNGEGAKNGPSLKGPTYLQTSGQYDEFVHIVTMGVPLEAIKDKSHANAMRPRGGPNPAPLTDTQIRAVAAYVYSLGHP